MRIILTGASGNLGNYLLEHLCKDEHQVLCLCNNTVIKASKNCEISMIGESNFETRFLGFRADAIIHAATKYGRKENFKELIEANVLFGVRMLELAKKSEIKKFLLIGTALENQVSPYALSKHQLLDWAKVIYDSEKLYDIRLQQFYGAKCDDSNFVTRIIKDCTGIKEINLTEGLQKRDFVYIDDVISAIDCLLKTKSSPNEPIEIGSGTAYPVREFIQYIHKSTNSKAKLNFGAVRLRENEPSICMANISVLKQLGWQAQYSYEQGLSKTIKEVIEK